MSRAFVKEDDQSVEALPDRAVSAARNLVTRRGRRLIEEQLARHRGALAAATVAGERTAMARAARELRYWAARAASAEVSEPPTAPERVVFGTRVTLAREDGSTVAYTLVGEDEADPAAGRIAWTTPVARALLGAETGELRALPTGPVEILAVAAPAEGDDQARSST